MSSSSSSSCLFPCGTNKNPQPLSLHIKTITISKINARSCLNLFYYGRFCATTHNYPYLLCKATTSLSIFYTSYSAIQLVECKLQRHFRFQCNAICSSGCEYILGCCWSPSLPSRFVVSCRRAKKTVTTVLSKVPILLLYWRVPRSDDIQKFLVNLIHSRCIIFPIRQTQNVCVLFYFWFLRMALRGIFDL